MLPHLRMPSLQKTRTRCRLLCCQPLKFISTRQSLWSCPWNIMTTNSVYWSIKTASLWWHVAPQPLFKWFCLIITISIIVSIKKSWIWYWHNNHQADNIKHRSQPVNIACFLWPMPKVTPSSGSTLPVCRTCLLGHTKPSFIYSILSAFVRPSNHEV